jgi:hypothetical protein
VESPSASPPQGVGSPALPWMATAVVLGRRRGEEQAASDESERGGKDSPEGATARRQGPRRVTREGPSRGRVGGGGWRSRCAVQRSLAREDRFDPGNGKEIEEVRVFPSFRLSLD